MAITSIASIQRQGVLLLAFLASQSQAQVTLALVDTHSQGTQSPHVRTKPAPVTRDPCTAPACTAGLQRLGVGGGGGRARPREGWAGERCMSSGRRALLPASLDTSIAWARVQMSLDRGNGGSGSIKLRYRFLIYLGQKHDTLGVWKAKVSKSQFNLLHKCEGTIHEIQFKSWSKCDAKILVGWL